ncbi:hypothetical protein [Streptomyces sp. DSM 40484]|uniref:hypothetical protein n=1 Tax=Streptomyces kroppenstedtii TaxID=3051181 RepID=UPI0028D2E8D7|nr:hypothetical protein [Streptomyces sp. DSM 40484]
MPTRAQRPHIPETSESQKKARLAFNAGATGTGRKPADLPVVETCRIEACGTPTGGPRPGPGMVQVAGAQDGAPAHWYCPDRCAAIARAHADLRSGGHRQVNP